MKALIVYYSYTGNTKKIAQMIQNEIGGDIAEIDTVVPYEGDYNTVVDQGHEEVNRGFMPQIKQLNVNLKDYDTVILGTPVWWYTFAPAVKTFLNNNDFSGKTIYTFATNGGWIGHTFKDVGNACTGANVKPGINIRFNESSLVTSENEIKKWIEKIGD